MSGALTDHDVASLSAACALNLSMFRRSHVQARVDRALALERIESVGELRQRMIDDETVRASFRRSVAISVTRMFRDPEQFDALSEVLREAAPPKRGVRAWSAGCSTGEEAWSIAATLAMVGRADDATVVGSDVLPENVRQARTLKPPPSELRGARVPENLKIRFECRDIVRQGAPGVGWDVVVCRNVAIYLDEERRHIAHRVLADAVGRGGLVMLGRSERFGDPASLGLQRIVPHIYRRTA